MATKVYQERNALKNKTFEVLLLDGGWLTPEALSLENGRTTGSNIKTLNRYIERGLVERRERRLVGEREPPYEYKVTTKALMEYEA